MEVIQVLKCINLLNFSEIDICEKIDHLRGLLAFDGIYLSIDIFDCAGNTQNEIIYEDNLLEPERLSAKSVKGAFYPTLDQVTHNENNIYTFWEALKVPSVEIKSIEPNKNTNFKYVFSVSYNEPQEIKYTTRVYIKFNEKSETELLSHLLVFLIPHIHNLCKDEYNCRRKFRNNDVLTIREKEVLYLVKKGISSKEVADSIFRSERTVKFHLKNIYIKLNVTSRIQAVLKGMEMGLLN